MPSKKLRRGPFCWSSARIASVKHNAQKPPTAAVTQTQSLQATNDEQEATDPEFAKIANTGKAKIMYKSPCRARCTGSRLFVTAFADRSRGREESFGVTAKSPIRDPESLRFGRNRLGGLTGQSSQSHFV